MVTRTKSNEREQKVVKRTLIIANRNQEIMKQNKKQRNKHRYMATKTKSNEMEQKVVKRTLINANINKK